MSLGKKFLKSLYIAGAVILLIGLSLALTYVVNFNDPISLMFKKIYPAVVVSTSPISVYDWQQNMEIARHLNPQGDLKMAQAELIAIKQKEELLQQMNVKLTSEKIAEEYNFDKSSYKSEYQEVIDDYFFGDERLFVQYVVFGQYFDSQLRIIYNSDTRLNAAAYKRAQRLLDRIVKGEKFEDVAKSDSDDKLTGQFGGDLGLVGQGDILPELMPALKQSTLGQVKTEIVTSRYGYHIIYPVELVEGDGQKIWHLKQILIKTDGYEQWLNPKLTNISIWRIK